MLTLERQVLDALPMTIYTVDLDGRITLLNRSWSRFAQTNGAPQLCDEGTVIGASIWDAIGDTDVIARVREAMLTLSEGRAPSVSWEFPCSSPTEERIFLMQLSAIREGRTLSGFAFSTVDITPSHRAREVLIQTGMALARTLSVERVLQEVTHQLGKTMACDTIAIALADEDTGILHLMQHSGYEPDEAAGLEERLSHEWSEAIQRATVVIRSSDKGIQITAPMISGNEVLGAVTLASTTPASPHLVDEARRVLATIAAETAAAIERAVLVRRLGTKRRLEAIGEVSAGVAHELRNPLFGISSAAQLLRFRVKDDPVVEKNVGRILREVERLNSMVTSLLEYGRPNPIDLKPGNPDTVWDEVIENQRGRLESRALILHRSRAGSASCAIDVHQLAQVCINILMNAADAAPEGSDLTLNSEILANGAWRCRLHNGGPAIPADLLPRVFEIFFSTKPGGTGIGLALCQRIIEEHRGTITVESAPEAGTSVTIILPPA